MSSFNMRSGRQERVQEAITLDDDVQEISSLREITTVDLTQTSEKLSTETVAETSVENSREERLPDSQKGSLTTLSCQAAVSPFHLATKRDEQTGLYKDGNYTAAQMMIHTDPVSIPVLDTPTDGMLHIITGWTHEDVVSDLWYRYDTKGRWEAKKCGFLITPQLLMKRGYLCNGVLACPLMLGRGDTFQHSSAAEWKLLQKRIEGTDQAGAQLMEKRIARNMYITLTSPGVQFCTANIHPEDPRAAGKTKCDGGPILRQVRNTLEWFVGCTNYHKYVRVLSSHRFVSLRHYTERARGYLQDMLQRNEPLFIPGDVCDFVAPKTSRGGKRCPTHGLTLVECGTSNSKVGRCEAKMCLYEPIGKDNLRAGDTLRELIYAICSGPHNHPPPPQPTSTNKKNALFREQAEKSPLTTASVLKLQTQQVLHRGSSSSMQNLNLSKNYVYNALNQIRRVSQGDEYVSMFELLACPDQPYVRDVRVVKDGIVFLLATKEMLDLGSDRLVFAGDATFKTVMENNPHYITPKWYLYNIVSPFDPTTPKHNGIVVCRALMTTLSADAYQAVWVMFLKALRGEREKRLGLSSGEVSINVPYLTLEPERQTNSIPIRAVTTDFEIAEVEGIGAAFAEQRGGSLHMHISHLLVGCRIHFERAVLKRAASMAESERTSFKSVCRKLRNATTQEKGDEYCAIIHNLDNSWGEWLSRSHVRPLVSPAYSDMSETDRMIALDNTNIVESQNRRGNLICGTGIDPVLCTQRLKELDTISTLLTNTLQTKDGQQLPRKRTRNGHTLSTQSRSRRKVFKGTIRKKQKSSESNPSTTAKEPMTTSKSKVQAQNDGPVCGYKKVVPSQHSGSLTWLHDELGTRCQTALDKGNEKLFVALSELYISVLESSDLNLIKYEILATMKKESADKLISHVFTELLLLTSKGASRKNEPINGTTPKQDISVLHADEEKARDEKDKYQPVEIVDIE